MEISAFSFLNLTQSKTVTSRAEEICGMFIPKKIQSLLKDFQGPFPFFFKEKLGCFAGLQSNLNC